MTDWAVVMILAVFGIIGYLIICRFDRFVSRFMIGNKQRDRGK